MAETRLAPIAPEPPIWCYALNVRGPVNTVVRQPYAFGYAERRRIGVHVVPENAAMGHFGDNLKLWDISEHCSPKPESAKCPVFNTVKTAR